MRLNLCHLATVAALVASGVASAQSSGSAFVVAPGLLVTNHHVVDNCGAIDVIAPDGRRPAAIVDSVEIIDLALLRVYGLRGGIASIRAETPVLLGEQATVFGFPLGGALSSTGNFTTGVVSSLRGLNDSAGQIQITAPVQPGNSGGPVLDRSGGVIGVVESKLDALQTVKATGDIPQNVNFAVSVSVLTDFLTQNNVTFKSVGPRAAIPTTQIAEMAQSFTYKIRCKAAVKTAAKPERQKPEPSKPTTSVPQKVVKEIQIALNLRGFDAGPADGIMGPRTRAAISSAQKTLGRVADGLPSNALLKSLKSIPISSGKVVGRITALFKGDKRFVFEFFDVPNARVGDLVFIDSVGVTAKIDKIKGKFAIADVIEGNGKRLRVKASIRRVR